MGFYPEQKLIREKCSTHLCEVFRNGKTVRKRCDSILEMDEYGAWSRDTGWSGDIYCTGCGRRVTYVGASYEKKADVEKKLRKLWHVANEEVV